MHRFGFKLADLVFLSDGDINMASEKALPLFPSPPPLEQRWMSELSGTSVMDLRDFVDQNKKDYSESQRFSFLCDED